MQAKDIKVEKFCPYRLRWLDHGPFKAADPDRRRVGTPSFAIVVLGEGNGLSIRTRWVRVPSMAPSLCGKFGRQVRSCMRVGSNYPRGIQRWEVISPIVK